MLWRLLLIASLVVLLNVDRIKGEESQEGSGIENEGGTDDDWEDDKNFEISGGGDIVRESIPRNRDQPPSVNEEEKERNSEDEGEDGVGEGGKSGGAGFVFDEKDDSKPENANSKSEEPVSVDENNLLTHPAVIAAIVVGGFLVLVCLVIFFVLIVCCVRKKDEGTYNLDKAMKEKLQYITYTKAEASEKEFFA